MTMRFAIKSAAILTLAALAGCTVNNYYYYGSAPDTAGLPKTAQQAAPHSETPAEDDTKARLDLHAIANDTTNGLVAYYSFEGNASDDSGNGCNGEPSGDVTYVPGVAGKAVHFGGVDSPGHIRVPNSDKLKFADAFSLSFWINIDDDATSTWMDGSGRKVPLSGQVVVAKSGDRAGFMIKRGEEAPDRRGMDVTAHAHTAEVAGVDSEEAVPLHQWTHIVLIADKTGTRIYQSGKLIANDAKVMHLDQVNAEDMYIGVQAGKGSNMSWWGPLHGAVDELRIYNRSLSDAEIKALATRD